MDTTHELELLNEALPKPRSYRPLWSFRSHVCLRLWDGMASRPTVAASNVDDR